MEFHTFSNAVLSHKSCSTSSLSCSHPRHLAGSQRISNICQITKFVCTVIEIQFRTSCAGILQMEIHLPKGLWEAATVLLSPAGAQSLLWPLWRKWLWWQISHRWDDHWNLPWLQQQNMTSGIRLISPHKDRWVRWGKLEGIKNTHRTTKRYQSRLTTHSRRQRRQLWL